MFLFKWQHRVAYAHRELYVPVSQYIAQALLKLFRRRENPAVLTVFICYKNSHLSAFFR